MLGRRRSSDRKNALAVMRERVFCYSVSGSYPTNRYWLCPVSLMIANVAPWGS